jgi:hypothetical protein
MTTKGWTAIGAAIVLTAGLAAAGEATDTSRALAERLLDAMQMRRTMEEQFDVMRKAQVDAIGQLMQGKGASPEATKRFQAMQGAMMKLIQEELTWASMQPEFVAAYAATFTEDELRGLIAFYQSPVGRTFVAKTPELTERTMAISSARVQALLPRFQQLMLEHLQHGPAPGGDDRT